ncbi:MAG: LysR family transcriptional regulator [Arenicella sp.]
MKNISTNLLRSFVTISDLGSFTQAADRLAKSQSSISLQIKKLEELIGQEVFSRQGHNFELTKSGETLLPFAKEILKLHDRALGELSGKELMGKVRLGIPSEFALRLLPRIVGDFSRKNPKVTLEVVCDLSRNLRNGLELNKYDLILAILDDPQPSDGESIIVDELVWACSAEGYSRKTFPVSLIAAPDGCIYRKRAIERLQQSGVPWSITYTIMDIAGITSAVEEGLGITVLARKTLPNTLKEIPPPFGSKPLGSIGLKLFHSAGENTSQASRFLAEYIKANL